MVDEFLTIKFNEEYYAVRLARTKKKEKFLEIYLALLAGGSGVAAFRIWDLMFWGWNAGEVLFSILVGGSLLFSIAKPYLGLSHEVERLAAIQSTYASIGHQMADVINQVQNDPGELSKLQQRFQVLRNIRGSQEAKEDKPADHALAEHCQQLIRDRFKDKIDWLHELHQNDGLLT